MPSIDLNHLLDLDALLAEGSVVGAAGKRHCSASVMSRRLNRLRDVLGDPLFVQAGRGLVPTERALALRERLRAVIEDMQGLLAPVELDLSTLDRTVTLRANEAFAGVWATLLSARLAAEAPRIRLRFMPRMDKSMEVLRNGEVDVDIGVLEEPAPEIKSQSLFRARFVGVVRANHPLSALPSVDAAQFIQWPHVVASRRGRESGPIDVALASMGLQRRVALVVPGFQSALASIEQSDLVAAMPEPVARWANARGHLWTFPLPVQTPIVNVTLSWHPRYQADPLHRWLREHIRAVTAEALSD
jgi:DNA-binding transcriptional LysR family regulator